ncbi:MAG: universal stress protein [Persephonella sp.]|nr:MAG: universal stress protein [Persephonella sp.]
MIEIRKVLAVVDFTPKSIKALEWAENIAERFNGELVVFIELEDVFSIIKASLGFSLPVPPNLKENEIKKAEEKIKSLLKNVDNSRYIIEAEGTIGERLPVVVDKEKPDLVVIYEDMENYIDKISSQILIIK